VERDNAGRRKHLGEQWELLSASLPDVDSAALAEAAYCQRFSANRVPACTDVHVISPTNRDSQVLTAALQPGALVVRMTIEYVYGGRWNEYRVIATHNRISEAPAPDPNGFVAWYVTPGPKDVRANPLRHPSDKESSKQIAAREYWLAGSPSRLETEIGKSLSEISEMARETIDARGSNTTPAATKAWARSLPTLDRLKDEGRVKCGFACGAPYLKSDASRVWYLLSIEPLAVVSAPFSAFPR